MVRKGNMTSGFECWYTSCDVWDTQYYHTLLIHIQCWISLNKHNITWYANQYPINNINNFMEIKNKGTAEWKSLKFTQMLPACKIQFMYMFMKLIWFKDKHTFIENKLIQVERSLFDNLYYKITGSDFSSEVNSFFNLCLYL